MSKIVNPTFGSDPEFIAINIDTQQPISCVGKIGGTKHEPLSIGEGCSRQEDNVLAEVCIPPVTNKKDFVKYITYAKNEVNKLLTKFNAKLISASSMEYPNEELQSKAARKFGCSESWCAWTGESVDVPPAEMVGNLRSAGFHIHIGFKGDIEDFDLIETLIRNMDKYLGLPSLIIDRDTDRRKIYGKAGDFRSEELADDIIKIEYRTLGANMGATDELMEYCFDQTLLAIEATNRGESPDPVIEKIIDNSDSESAALLIEEYGINLPGIFVENELKVELHA